MRRRAARASAALGSDAAEAATRPGRETDRRRTGAARTALALASLALLAAAPRASADEPAPGAPELQRPAGEPELRGRAELRAGVVLFDYLETLDGESLDREHGVIPALSGELEVGGRRAFGRLSGRLAGGTVDYHGQVQAPTAPAIDGVWASGQSDAQLLEARLEGGAWVDPARRLAVFAGVGARQWQRTIHDTVATGRDGLLYQIQGLSETYGWWDLDLGARYAIVETEGDGWDVEAALVQTVSPGIQVSYAGSNLSLDLGARLGWRASTSWRHRFAPSWFAVAGLWGEGYRFGASAAKDVGGGQAILEPDSRTFRLGLELGVGARF